MADAKDLTSWESLTGFVNETDSPNQFVKRLVYSAHDPVGTKKITYGVLSGGREAAPFVRMHAQALEVTPFDEKEHTVQPPHIRIKRHLEAEELLNTRRPGEAVFITGGQAISVAERKVAENSQRLSDMVTDAEEYLCALSLQGSISVQVAEQANFQITYPRSASHNFTISPKWDAGTTENPLADVLAIKRLVSNDDGSTLTHMLLGNAATDAFLGNSDVRTLLDNRRLNPGELDLNRPFIEDGAIFLGVFEGLQVWHYGREVTVEGSAVKLIRDKYAEFVSVQPRAMNTLYYGAVQDLDAMDGQRIAVERFSKSWKQPDPSVMWQLLESNPLPVPKRPDSMVSAQVAT